MRSPLWGSLVALEIVLARFCSIQAWNLRIGFSFLPIAMASIRFGPIPAAMAASAADILGAVLFPTTGAYFPGFTLTAFLTGVIFGLCLYRRQTAGHILAAVLLNQLGSQFAAEYHLAFDYVSLPFCL